MRSLSLMAALAVAVLFGGCNRQTSKERSDSVARQAGKAAYKLDQESKRAAVELDRDGKKAAKDIQRGLNRATDDARQGWNEAKHQDQTRK